MKKLLILTFCLFVFGATSKAQIVLQESFSGSSAPANWQNTAVSTGLWLFSTNPGWGVAGTPDHTVGGGTNYAWVDFSNDDDTTVTLTAPAVSVASLTTPYLEFAYESYYSGNSPSFQFNLLMAQAWNGASWDTIVSLQPLPEEEGLKVVAATPFTE